MIGKIIGAFAGSKMAESTSSLGGPTGAVLGLGAAAIAKRLSLPVLVAVTAGGYFAKKYMDKNNAQKVDVSKTPLTTKPRGPQKPVLVDSAAA